MRLRSSTLPPSDIEVWTGLSVKQFHALLQRLLARRPDTGRSRPWALESRDRVLLMALAYGRT